MTSKFPLQLLLSLFLEEEEAGQVVTRAAVRDIVVVIIVIQSPRFLGRIPQMNQLYIVSHTIPDHRLHQTTSSSLPHYHRCFHEYYCILDIVHQWPTTPPTLFLFVPFFYIVLSWT